MTATADALESANATTTSARSAPLPDVEPEPNGSGARLLIGVFVAVPLLALAAAVPVAWGWGLGWHDVVIGLVFYVISGMGISMGFHRHFTHNSFKASKPLRIVLAIAGSLAVEGPVLVWAADHRRHHKYSDREGDPHSPWRFGCDVRALTKGFLYAHIGWLFNPARSSQQKFVPDLLADRPIRLISRLFPLWVAVSLLAPALIGGLWSMSLTGALTAFFWASLIRICLLHHVTWSINSVCHTFGNEDFQVRDKSRNVAWLAIPSFGESWHNLHHADPTCARHGALKGQIDISARVIRWAELAGWAWDVRWPDENRLTGRLTGLRGRQLGSMTKGRLARPEKPAAGAARL
ncbi:MAG: acyl-CoA desaturase [Actinobacteria bacterium]|nr:acyl-CoA desaturase [Actinomycetota bacterium]MBO0824230.1 acyl-CoA desaturase [Actinomycetota bacterium]